MNKIIIAVDGYSSSGKSTMAKALARRIGYVYVDSGAMYRAVTLYGLRNGLITPAAGLDAPALVEHLDNIAVSFAVQPDGSQHTLLNGADVESEIRGLEVSSFVSPVAALPEVRDRLTALQKQYGANKGIVMDGRDIGTTVFPDAEMKVFVNASPEVRARRRFDELREKGASDSYESVLANIRERDYIDTHRDRSPLRQAEDAFVLDNDSLSREEQLQVLVDLFTRITSPASEHNA